MNFRIKICGITNVDDALAAVEAGADAVGLNFFSGSPRCIQIAEAERIGAALALGTERVGVFVNASADEIRRIASDTADSTDPAARRRISRFPGAVPWRLRYHSSTPARPARDGSHRRRYRVLSPSVGLSVRMRFSLMPPPTDSMEVRVARSIGGCLPTTISGRATVR